MTRESVLNHIKVCPKCHAAYIEELGEICRCPVEEPVVTDWEDTNGQQTTDRPQT